MLSAGQDAEEGEETAVGLMKRLGISQTDLSEGAYIDLLKRD